MTSSGFSSTQPANTSFTQLRHRYFAAWPQSDSVVELKNGSVWDHSFPAEWRYPLAVLSVAEQSIQDHSLHFYLTKDANKLPEYGPHVVAVLLQEEHCRIPAYACHIRGVVRSLPCTPFPGFRFHPLNLVLAFEYLRDQMFHKRSKQLLRAAHPEWPSRLHAIPRIYTIPVGYHSHEELAPMPMRERSIDLFFPEETDAPYRFWTSETQTRRQLREVLDQLRKHPEWHIHLDKSSAGDAVARTAHKMMNSRICLAPRGATAETFRLYEGLRAGCLVIANPLPEEPFLKGAPVLQVNHWNELPDLLRKYARDLDALEHYHQASLDRWQNHCHEKVIGPQVGLFLNGCPGGCP